MRSEIKELINFNKYSWVFSLFFSKAKKSQQIKTLASTEISYQFLAQKIPVLRRNKATNSSIS